MRHAASVLLAASALLAGCYGGTYIPTYTGPSEPTPQQVTIEITGNGVSPTAASGPRSRIQFLNRDTQVHDIQSNPHPDHSGCAELNLGAIEPGHTVSILTPFESGRACGYHDETRPDDTRFNGSISIR